MNIDGWKCSPCILVCITLYMVCMTDNKLIICGNKFVVSRWTLIQTYRKYKNIARQEMRRTVTVIFLNLLAMVALQLHFAVTLRNKKKFFLECDYNCHLHAATSKLQQIQYFKSNDGEAVPFCLSVCLSLSLSLSQWTPKITALYEVCVVGSSNNNSQTANFSHNYLRGLTPYILTNTEVINTVDLTTQIIM